MLIRMDRTQRQRKAEMIKSGVFETNKEEKPGCLLVIPLRDPSIAAKSVPSPNDLTQGRVEAVERCKVEAVVRSEAQAVDAFKKGRERQVRYVKGW